MSYGTDKLAEATADAMPSITQSLDRLSRTLERAVGLWEWALVYGPPRTAQSPNEEVRREREMRDFWEQKKPKSDPKLKS